MPIEIASQALRSVSGTERSSRSEVEGCASYAAQAEARARLEFPEDQRGGEGTEDEPDDLGADVLDGGCALDD
jgi:hypothetical protein